MANAFDAFNAEHNNHGAVLAHHPDGWARHDMSTFLDRVRITYKTSRLNRTLWWIALFCIATLVLDQLFLMYLHKRYPKSYIDEQFASLKEEYGIKIAYEIGDDFFSPLENPPIPAGPIKGSKVEAIRHRVLLRYPKLLKQALRKYPIKVVKEYLNAIYFAGTIEYDGFEYAGTYDPFRKILYLVDHGWKPDDMVEEVIHHEFGSLLIKGHSMFLNPWFEQNPDNFEYICEKNEDCLKIYKQSSIEGRKKDYEDGFMNSYAQTNFENDFNEYSGMIFTYLQKFKEIMAQYPRVRGKFLVWLKFYQEIDPVFTEEYLFGNGRGGK
jgi:hypothetical protein